MKPDYSMRKILLLSSFIICSSCGAFNDKWPNKSFINKYDYEAVISDSQIEKYPEVFTNKLDESPMYPKGVNGIRKYISKNYEYPKEARQKGLEGKLYVSFIIATEGWLKDVEVVKSPNEIFNSEAIRITKAMDRWIPAKLNGEYVEFRYTIPIALKLN